MTVLDDEVRIGLLWPKTGPKTKTGAECIEAGHGTIAMLEAEGVIPRGRVRLLEGDSHSVESTLSETERLIGEGAHVVHGTILSDWAVPAARAAAAADVVYWEAVAASEDITDQGLTNFFRANVNCSRYAADMARFIGETLVPSWDGGASTTVAVVYTNASFTRSLAEMFRDQAERHGLRVTAFESVAQTPADYGDLLRDIAAKEPDVVVASTFDAPVPELYRTAVEMGIRPRAWLGTGSWALHYKVDSLGPLLDGVYAAGTPHLSATAPERLGERGRRRFSAWKRATTIPHSDSTAVDRDLSVLALETLIADVLPRVESWGVDNVRNAALALDLPLGDNLLGYGMKFDELGNNERSFAAILQWQGGKLETVDPPLIATAAPMAAGGAPID